MNRSNLNVNRKNGNALIFPEIASRLSGLRRSQHCDRNAMEARLGLYRGAWGDFENGKRLPTTEQLIHISEYLNVDIHWLLTGKGAMFAEQTAPRPEHQTREFYEDQVALWKTWAGTMEERVKKLEEANAGLQRTNEGLNRSLNMALMKLAPKEGPEPALLNEPGSSSRPASGRKR